MSSSSGSGREDFEEFREKSRKVHGERIEAAKEALRKIFSKSFITRREAVKILQEVYRARAVTPIRGKAWPEDLWDKEMATLYAVAKHMLGLDSKDPDVFHQVFSTEEALEEAANAVLSHEDPQEAKRFLGFFLGGSFEDNTIARMFRVVATEVVLGFRPEEDIEKLLSRLPKIAPELENITRKYARYYIALRTAQEIAAGGIRNRIDKEVYKQALAAKIGLPRIMPDDEYIASIAQSVFRVPKEVLNKILSQSRGQEEKLLEKSGPRKADRGHKKRGHKGLKKSKSGQKKRKRKTQGS